MRVRRYGRGRPSPGALIRAGRLMAAAPVSRGGRRRHCRRGRGRGGEPIPVLAHLAHERPDLLEIRLVPADGVDAARTPSQPAPMLGSRRRAQTIVHDGRTVGLVFLQMPVQVGLLPEASFAQRTFERFLFVVYVPHVPLQVGRYAERPFAVVALVRLFAGVRP